MTSKRKKNKRKDGYRGETAVSSPTGPSLTLVEVPSPPRMPTGFNMDDFLFSKLFKSVNVEGKRTINEVLRALLRQRMTEKSSVCTLGQILNEGNLSRKATNIITRCGKKLLEENPLNAEFDITCGVRLLQVVFFEKYRKLSERCQAQIHSLRELRNTLSHKYPLVLHDFEAHNEKLSNLLEKNVEFVTLVNEITDLEEKKNGLDGAAERNEIQGCIEEKKKEKYVFTEIENLRIILNDILENVSSILEEDFTACMSLVNKNLTDVSKAKVQQYDQDTYDREIKRFKDDPIHDLITKGREELKAQYRCLKIANPCPWICMDQNEKLSINNFSIEKIYTPLRIEDSRDEISTQNLLVIEKSQSKTMVPPALVLYGLAGSGKTSLCLHFLHHWTEDTNEIEILKDYNLVIYVELRAVRSNNIVSYLKEQKMKKSTFCISAEDLVQQLDNLKLLFIIDGYDEAKGESKNVVKDIFAKFQNQSILVTTRTEFLEEVKLIASKAHVRCKVLEICGFDESRVEKFTEKVFQAVMQSKYYVNKPTSRAKTSSEFLQYVQGRGRILEKHLELPLTLALMIYMWIDCPQVLSNITTCTSLYYELFKLCQKKIKDRLSLCGSDRDLEKLLILVGKKAWKLLLNDEDVLADDDEAEIDEECKKRKVPKEELLSAFLMYEAVNFDDNLYDYSFMHRTQMEYLSAYYWAEQAEEEDLNDVIEQIFSLSAFHQIIIFLVGHLTRKEMLDQKLEEVFKLLDQAGIEGDSFNFWWRLLTESQINGEPNENLALEICREKLNKKKWKLSQATVVSGLELLIATPVQLDELIIEIENGTDPYNIKDFLRIMQSLKANLQGRYGKNKPILTELFFWQHFISKCDRPSNDLLTTLYPWGHLRDFTGSVGKFNESFMLNFCYKVKNLRVRVETKDAQASLASSLAKIRRSVRQLRVILALDPKACDPDELTCLTYDSFIGKLELTLPHMKNEDKDWIVQVVKRVSGKHRCCRLFLEKTTLSCCTVLYIMEMLRGVVYDKYTVQSIDSPTNEQFVELKKQQKRVHVDLEWI